MSALAPRGPIGVTVRLHRVALWTGVALLTAAAGLLLYQRFRAADLAGAFPATGCSVNVTTRACGGTVRAYLDAEMDLQSWFAYAGLAPLILPGAVGALVAGPMIAREFEAGTYRLAWTQSVTPARWLASKLVVPLAYSVTAVSAFIGLYRWAWHTGPTENYDHRATWSDPTQYIALGPVVLAYTVLGIALGAVAGLLLRRTVLAMSVTFLAVGAVTLAFVARLRAHLWPVLTDTSPIDAGRHSWVLEDGVITPSGQRIPREECVADGWSDSPCMELHTGATRYVDYHPASHFWPLQLVETGIILLLAAAAAYAAFRVLRRLHG